jgi:hypothetical protein
MNQTLKEIRQRIKPIGTLALRKTNFTIHVHDDQVTFDRTPEGLQQGLDLAKQIEEDYTDART